MSQPINLSDLELSIEELQSIVRRYKQTLNTSSGLELLHTLRRTVEEFSPYKVHLVMAAGQPGSEQQIKDANKRLDQICAREDAKLKRKRDAEDVAALEQAEIDANYRHALILNKKRTIIESVPCSPVNDDSE